MPEEWLFEYISFDNCYWKIQTALFIDFMLYNLSLGILGREQ